MQKTERGMWMTHLMAAVIVMLTMLGISPVQAEETLINLEKAGTLKNVLDESATNVKITGKLNGTDLKYLRHLALDKSMSSLDLSEATIVKGGEAYFENKKAEDDVLGESLFYECKKLREIVLPQTITAIGTNAFARTGLKSIDIPNSVAKLGGDAFAYCSSLNTVVIGRRVSSLSQGVFYSSNVRNAYVKPTTPPSVPAYLFSSNPVITVYSDVLDDYKQSGWKDYGTIKGKLEDKYPEDEDPSKAISALLGNYFEDSACTQLKAEYQAMTDEALATALTEGGLPDFMVTIATRIKNDQWAAYEKDFRIQDYRPFSDAKYWNDYLHSTGGSYMGNPTGIYASSYDPLYVFVDADVESNATLYIEGCIGNSQIENAKAGKKLTRGLNIIDGKKDALYYIIYTADTKSQTKTLAEWPDIKIHIEGGVVNGFYDLKRHSDKDYRAILKAATHERFTVKGDESLFNFKTKTYRAVFPGSIDRDICWFDSLTVWQKELMGFCQSVATGERDKAPYYLSGGTAIFPIYYNNPNFAIEGESADAGWANSTPFRTSYNSEACVRSAFDVARSDHDDWCAAHECGHNNQGLINLEGCTETSNNLFSNVIRFLDGTVTSSGNSVAVEMNDFAHHVIYPMRDVNTKIRMYYQLYLYYHQAQKNTSFYPELFQELRKSPITPYTNTNNSMLKFVRLACKVANEDLTDFFRAWGFFEPCSNLPIEDYGDHKMTIRQADINRTLNEIAQYPKKNREILFVEDRVDYVLTRGFLTTAGKKRRESEQVGKNGDLGQFTSYLPGACQPGSYTYLQADSLYAMEGNGGVGFIMLDDEDNMVFASNARKFCIPSCVPTPFNIFSIDADGTLHEVTRMEGGEEYVNVATAGMLADSLTDKAIKATISGTINGTDIKYLRQLIDEGNLSSLDLQNVKIASGGSAYYQSYRSAANAIGDHAFYECRNLTSIILPQTITKITTNAFARSGIQKIIIPDAVTSLGGDAFAYCDQLNTVVIGKKVKSTSQGVFYSSAIKDVYCFPTTPPNKSAYLFSSNPVIHIYAKALNAYKTAGWEEYGTLVGDLDDHEDITAIDVIEADEEAPAADNADAPIYDLSGRRATSLQHGTFYIQGGKVFRME